MTDFDPTQPGDRPPPDGPAGSDGPRREPAPRWPATPWPTAPPRTDPLRRRALAVLLVVAALALLAGLAGGIVVTEGSSRSGFGFGFGGSTDDAGDGRAPVLDEFGSSSATTSLDIDARRIANAVSPAVVNISATLTSGNQTAGSGVVIASSGLVITNNHVINGAVRIDVEVGVTGDHYTAEVLGYDVDDDVALLELENASGMSTIKTAGLATISLNDEVVAIGNALGTFGPPTVVPGTITALNQSIIAGDGLDRETLENMIRVAASIKPGDSGGALVDEDGRVIGINTAADAGLGRFGYEAGTTGFAIPIETAMAIAEQIRDGDSSGGVHIGERALLGVVLSGPSEGFASAGATVTDVAPDSPAESAGIDAGDTITSLDGRPVHSGEGLRRALDRYHPGDRVTVRFRDRSGDTHRATVTLIEGPPA